MLADDSSGAIQLFLEAFMKQKLLQVVLVSAALAAPLALTGCDKKEKGPAEQAGAKIDEAMKKAGDAVSDAGKKAADAAQDAGKAVEDAGKKAGDAVETAGKKAGEAVEAAGQKAGEAAQKMKN